LNISHIRQLQQDQTDVFELEIRKLKQQLADQVQENKKIASQMQRDRELAAKEKTRFQE